VPLERLKDVSSGTHGSRAVNPRMPSDSINLIATMTLGTEGWANRRRVDRAAD